MILLSNCDHLLFAPFYLSSLGISAFAAIGWTLGDRGAKVLCCASPRMGTASSSDIEDSPVIPRVLMLSCLPN